MRTPLYRIKHICQLGYGDALPKEEEFVGEIPVFGSNGQYSTTSHPNTKEPVILIGRKGSYGKINWSPSACYASDTTFFVDERFTKAELRWLYWAFQSLALDEGTQEAAVPGLNRETVYEKRLFYPDFQSQQKIANYLDRETAHIDALIAEKERMLALLEEKRAALISQAVTRGLDPDVPLKPSGLDWLGDIPVHWNVVRLKYLAQVRGGLTLGKRYSFGDLVEMPYLRVANVQDGYLKLDEVTTVEVSVSDAKNYLLKYGDVLMNEGGDIDKLGRGCVWHEEIVPCLHQNHVFAVRPHATSSEWLTLWTSTFQAKFYFESKAKRATNLASISGTNIKELPVLMPPEAEQNQIWEYIKQSTTKIEKLRSELMQTVSLLKERRAALITAAVTGQFPPEEMAI